MTEYRFDYASRIPPGRVVFRVKNPGRENHGMTLLPIADGSPPVEEQVLGTERQILSHKTDIQVAFGQETTFAVDLPVGRYAMVCFLVSPDGVPHGRRGMFSEFRVN